MKRRHLLAAALLLLSGPALAGSPGPDSSMYVHRGNLPSCHDAKHGQPCWGGGMRNTRGQELQDSEVYAPRGTSGGTSGGNGHPDCRDMPGQCNPKTSTLPEGARLSLSLATLNHSGHMACLQGYARSVARPSALDAFVKCKITAEEMQGALVFAYRIGLEPR